MRLSANVITKGRYYRAGEDVPDDLLTDALKKYEVTDEDPEESVTPKEVKPAAPRKLSASYVNRDGRFVLASNVYPVPGEILYWRRKRSFGVDEKYIAYSRVPLNEETPDHIPE